MINSGKTRCLRDKVDKIAVLIPCCNESATIGKVIDDWRSELPEAVIYVYDNNSTDGTPDIAKSRGAVVRFEYKQGKGNVVRRMFREIDAECYIMVDGDDTYSASEARRMADLVLEMNADMVIGDRLSSTYFSENKRRFHSFGNVFVRRAVNAVFKSDIKDVMTGCRAFSYLFVKSFPVLSKGFEIETEMTIHAIDKNMSVETVVIQYRDRPYGSESKLKSVPDGIKVVGTIFRMFRDHRPCLFFSVLALILTALSAGFFIPVLITYINTGLVPNFPTLIVCGFVFIAAIISYFSGLVLESIRRSDSKRFELALRGIYNEFIEKIKKDKK